MDVQTAFDKFKAFCEKLTAGKAPWWVVPVAAAVLLAILL